MEENKIKEKNETIIINKKQMKKTLIIIISILILLSLLVFIVIPFIKKHQEGKLYSVKNQKQLEELTSGNKSINKSLYNVISMFDSSHYPFEVLDYLLDDLFYGSYMLKSKHNTLYDGFTPNPGGIIPSINSSSSPILNNSTTDTSKSTDYSKTNIQVENVDEADIIKTDGGYVYSISDNSVLITDVMDKKKPQVLSEIKSTSSTYPTDILINGNKIVVISINANTDTNNSYKYYNYSNNRTSVQVYDITDKTKPKKLKNLDLNTEYNISRMIDNKIYIFTKTTGKVDFKNYKENYKEQEIEYNKIKYLKNDITKAVTTLVVLDLDKPTEDAKLSSYFVDLENAYISTKNIYLLSSDSYRYERTNLLSELKSIFGFKGVFGKYDNTYIYRSANSKDNTKITKYSITNDNDEFEFEENTRVKGKILNQYSCDEKDDNLRIVLNDKDGTRIKVLNSNLKEIGDTGPAAPGEDNKSVRFAGDRAYFVTYKKVDPLYAVDLSDPTNPTILGELEIPGFSNYLHPYNENYIIGIGMATNETLVRDYLGRPLSERITFNGMKMTIFDISDIRNPKEKDVIYFGDSKTDSQINKDARALLFSKEKNLIAIPVSNMGSVNPTTRFSNSSNTNNTLDSNKVVIHENVEYGYIVFDISEEGFKYKGIITHEEFNFFSDLNRELYSVNFPLRGLYIDDNLITVSNNLLKINKLDTLEFISNINLLDYNLNETEIGKTFKAVETEKKSEEDKETDNKKDKKTEETNKVER